MRLQFDQQLRQLKAEMLDMGGMCQMAIQQIVESILNGDASRVKNIHEMMNEISQQERSIENICLKLLMQQQPVARDLRTISAALKMVTDMERIGIQACEIAEIIAKGNIRNIEAKVDFKELADEITKMVGMTIESFECKDIDLAHEVIAYDDVVDNLFCAIREELIEKIKNGGSDAEYFVDMLMIDKYFERIGDHAVNIAKWVCFSITGVIKIV